MSRLAVVLIAAVMGAPLLVQAQTTGYGGGRTSDYTYSNPDMNYCAALADLYVRYVGRSEAGPRSNRRPDVDGGVAVYKCHSGDTATAIPMLEKMLTDSRITLPARN